VEAQKVDLNEEIVDRLDRFDKTRDMKLRSVQSGVARAVAPLVGMVESLMDGSKKVDRQKLVDNAVDTVTILAHANAMTNQIRRETLKPKLERRYQPLCYRAPKGNSQWLLGDNLPERIKTVAQGGRLTRRGRGMGYRGRYQPYFGGQNSFRGRGSGGQRQPFLGGYWQKFWQKSNRYMVRTDRMFSQEMLKIQEQDVFAMIDENENNDKSLYICRPRQGPELAKQQLQRELPRQGEDRQVNRDDQPEGVGELKDSIWHTFEAGRISDCAKKWAEITSDWVILQAVRGFHINFPEVPTQERPARELKYSQAEREFMKKEIQELLNKGVIQQVEHVEGEYISNVFLREKKDKGKFRMILNLKKLNEYIPKQKFKMDTLIAAITMVHEGCWFLSLDFTDAYYSVRIAPESRKFLRFEFEGNLYEFTCLPNGLRPAPRLFTKLVKVPLAVLRKQYGINITAYLDDTLLIFDSPEEAIHYGEIASELFQELGFMISFKKSVIVPTQRIEFLGVIIDSRAMNITLPAEKSRQIKEEVKTLIESDRCTIRFMAHVLGKLQATASANSFAALHTKEIEKAKNINLRVQRGQFDASMEVPDRVKSELTWWLQNSSSISAPILTGDPEYVIFTDASLKGWGYYDPQTKESGGGRWSEYEGQKHINVLELMAVELALKIRCENTYNKHVRVMSDNTTTVASIKKQGSLHSQDCNRVAQRIWTFMLQRGNWISAAHCPGVENVEADRASREFKENLEWTLNQKIFDRICRKLEVQPEIDLFASRLNNKLSRYVAWQPDPGAESIDAFTKYWGGGTQVYIFPPFGMLPRVLQKFRHDRAEGLMIVPFWPTKPWFTVWAKLLIERPILLTVTDDVLYLPYRLEGNKEVKPMNKLQLLAGNLSGDPSLHRGFRNKLLTPSIRPEGDPQMIYMNAIGNYGDSFVVHNKWIQCMEL
jgi:uncharacterized protein YqgQ